MKITGKPQLPVTFPANLSSKTLNPSPDSDLQHNPISRKAARRPTHLKRTVAPSGRRSRPETPLLRWKVEGGVGNDRVDEDERSVRQCGRRTRRRGRDDVVVSARKLAAGLWRLQLPNVASEAGLLRRSEALVGLQVRLLCQNSIFISFLFGTSRSVSFRFFWKIVNAFVGFL